MPGLAPVTNIKKAAALSALGVRLVDPQISRVLSKSPAGVIAPAVGFHFALTTDDGATSTVDLIAAYDNPLQNLDKPAPIGLMPLLRAVLDNRDRLVSGLKDALARAGSVWKELQDPVELQDLLSKAAADVFPMIMTKRGSGYLILPANASEKTARQAIEHL